METTNYKLDFKKLAIILLSVIIIVLSMKLHQKSSENSANLKNIEVLNVKLNSYFLKNGQLVLSVENLNMTNSELKNKVSTTDKKLKEFMNEFHKVKTVTKYITKTKIDTLKIAYTDTVNCVFEKIGEIVEKDYSFKYKSNQNGIDIQNLEIKDTVSIVTGVKRKWFLGKETETFDITHSNKNITTENIKHIEVREHTKWYRSTLFKIGVGVIGGAFICK